MSEASQSSIKKTFVLAAILSYFQMKAISGVLTTMRNISLAIHLPLIGVIVPAIGSLIFNTFFELATYDTIEQVELNENTFKFSDEALLGNPVPP